MRIAIFTDVFLEVPGGIPSSIRAQMEYLKKNGHSAVVFCPAWKVDGKYAVIDGKVDKEVVGTPTAKHLKPGGAPFSKGVKVVKSWIKEQFPDFGKEFDLVHVHYEAACSMAGMQLAREFNLPLVQTMHGREDVAVETNVPSPFKTIGGWLVNSLHAKHIPEKVKVHPDDYLAPTKVRASLWTLMVNHANYADAVITPSKHFRDKLQHYGVSKPFYVVSNAISDEALLSDLKAAKVVDKKETTKTAFSKVQKELVRKFDGEEPLRLMWNSRVSREKRIMPFLEALTMTKKPMYLEVYGDGNDLVMAKKYAADHGLDSKVKFFGRVAHETILSKMRDKHLGIMVSNGFDNQSMTILESRAVGLPMFYCDPDMDEVVAHGGAVRSRPSAMEMAMKLDDIAEHPEMVEEMSKKCLETREEVLQSYQIKKLIKIYEDLVKK